jgi:DNA-binding PucR family transcriptional regulator
VLETAAAFDFTGVVELQSLGALSLVTATDEIARRLDEEWFGHVDDRFADFEHTVSTFLEAGQRVEATAARLHVHANTVRYRLTRFREVTLLDVRKTNDLVLAWWLLKRRECLRRGGEPESGSSAVRRVTSRPSLVRNRSGL